MMCLGGRGRLRTKCQMLQRLALHRTAAAAATAAGHPRIIRLWSLAAVASAAKGEVDIVARVAAPIARSLAGHHTRPGAAALTTARSAARWYLHLVTAIGGASRRLAAVAIRTKGEIDVITRRTPPISLASAPALAATLAAAAAVHAARSIGYRLVVRERFVVCPPPNLKTRKSTNSQRSRCKALPGGTERRHLHHRAHAPRAELGSCGPATATTTATTAATTAACRSRDGCWRARRWRARSRARRG